MSRFMVHLASFSLLLSLGQANAHAQQRKKFEANYDESKIPAYQLPEFADWQNAPPAEAQRIWDRRRPEILQQFAEHMYGKQPTLPFELQCESVESGLWLGGKARREQFRLNLSTKHGKHSIDLLVYSPASADGAVPCFLGLNFYGNHTVTDDPAISITQNWSRSSTEKGVENNRATEKGRGTSQSRWPVAMLIDAGVAVATVYCGDIDPDYDDGFENGVHALFPEYRDASINSDGWGTIAAWSWGLSRALDCLDSHCDAVDGDRVVVVGHSRLGKTALWTAATDERFAGSISNNSGCGGAALSRRAIGETVGRINDVFPHWFCGNFKKYNERESELPIDQHQLVALVAPRPVYVASASGDRWADPKGEFLSTKIAGEVYQRLGYTPLQLKDMPGENQAAIGVVSYHLRAGKHDINAWDWQNYLEFMQRVVVE